jgi:pyridoxamine 5'-phosphate oxidase
MPEAMTLATATAEGVPAARMVILRGLERGLAFFTDLSSDKAVELAANPRAAVVLHWLRPVNRQVRVAGPVEPVSEEEADEYWRTRPPATRRNAIASQQSSVIADQSVLLARIQDLHHPGTDLSRPARWGGFRVLPDRVEFWQESPDGLHDRIRYQRAGDGWMTERLSP